MHDGHDHDHLGHPGHFHERDAPLERDYRARAFTVGIGGPVGSGKTALLLALCRHLRETNLAQTAPLADLFGAMHDRLYSRLFQS